MYRYVFAVICPQFIDFLIYIIQTKYKCIPICIIVKRKQSFILNYVPLVL